MNTANKIKLILLGATSAIFKELGEKEGVRAVCDMSISDQLILLSMRIEEDKQPLNTSWIRINMADELVADSDTISFLEALQDNAE